MRVLLGKMTAWDVNLYQNDFAAGLPSPFATLGLADVIGVACGLDRWSTRVLPIYHDIEISPARLRPEYRVKGGRFLSNELSETLTGLVEFSLILDFQDRVNCACIEAKLLSLRLAGSGIFPCDKKIHVREINKDGDALFSCRRGYAFTALGAGLAPFAPVSYGEKETLEVVYDELRARRQAGGGWFVPAAVSYEILNDGGDGTREGMRDTRYPHRFAEPGVSIGELISIRNIRLTDVDEDTLNQAFWSWNVTETGAFAHKIYA